MALRLRPAEIGDWARLWGWRTDPEAADNSESRSPTLAEHMAWLKEVVGGKRKNQHLFVAVRTSNFETHVVGTGRVDIDKTTATLSLTIDPAHRSTGIANSVIEQLVTKALNDLKAKKILARVRTTNTASMRAFANNGFVPTKFEGDFTVLERTL